MRKNLEDARQQLLAKDTRFVEMMRHGSMTVEWYAPQKVDLQQPHTQDELYVIMSGSGKFQNGIETYSFGPGDVLFVAAGVEHRFFDFTDGFGTWVIFYGPQGGEKGEQ